MRVLWFLLALIPGAPAIALGRLVGGSLLLILGSIGWNVGLYARFFLEEGDLGFLDALGVANLEIGGFTLGVAAVLVSVLWTARLTSTRLAARRKIETDAALESAHEAFLVDDLDAASDAVRRGLRADHRDIDLLFLEWRLAEERDEPRRARRARKRLRRNDLDEKWAGEMERTQIARRLPPRRPPSRPIPPAALAVSGATSADEDRQKDRDLALEHD